jgi:hypothetical protein
MTTTTSTFDTPESFDYEQASKRLALPALWSTFAADRTIENFDAYRAAWVDANPALDFPYEDAAPEGPDDSPEIVIGFANAGLKVHNSYRCGMSRTARVHNTPHLIEGGVEEEFQCKRCGGPDTVATAETIEAAWTQTFRGSKRSPYGGMDETYIVSQMMQMQDRLAEMEEGA